MAKKPVNKSVPKRPSAAALRKASSYLTLNGQRISLRKHDTDFCVLGAPPVEDQLPAATTHTLSNRLTRVSSESADGVDDLMTNVRASGVAHHVYVAEEYDEEIIIDDRLLVTLKFEDAAALAELATEYSLIVEGRFGGSHVLRVTEGTGMNPLKAANLIAELDAVESASPQVMVELVRSDTPALFGEQWYLNSELTSHFDLSPGAGVRASEAWQISKGDEEIVVAVIDDGYDLGHPAFNGTRLHSGMRDFEGGDSNPASEDRFVTTPQGTFNDGDYHGTPVASIAVGSHSANSAMRGIAPNCTFLPIRIGFGGAAAPIDMAALFNYVSQRADVVNCSFGIPPSGINRLGALRTELAGLAQTGGRRGKGLVMVFAAGNDDAPTFMRGQDNVNGVKYTSGRAIREVPAGNTVFSGYPMTPGVIVVGAMSSRKRKSGYSSWGPHITVTAPSNNTHYIQAFISPGSDPRREEFLANYRGLGQVAASNRPGNGVAFQPLRGVDDPATPDLQENAYTKEFGGTSGAAPVVTGIVALMLSVNRELTAEQVRTILMATADTDLDAELDLQFDPNTQGLTGEFVAGRSHWFGSGKVNAVAAVSRAQSLAPPSDPPSGGTLSGSASPDTEIPDNRPQGITSTIELSAAGALASIEVDVDIDHSWRGDLILRLVSPEGFVAELHSRAGRSLDDIRRTYTNGDTADLATLVAGEIEVQGVWTLHVSDRARRDIGRLNNWAVRVTTL